MGTFRMTASLVLAAGCSSSPAPSAKWQLVAEQLPAAVLSVWAGSPTNVWVVGGATSADGPLVAHYDGTTWTKFATGLTNTNLWWVKGFDDGNVFIGGSQGTILRTTDGSTFTQMTTPPGNVTVFGIWGASSSDVWAVGGTGIGGGFLWRYDGTSWTVYPNVPPEVANGTCWKVNGRSASDVWMSGTLGTVLHWDGSLSTTTIPDAAMEQDSLFSIDANSQRAITVGGGSTGVIYENDSTGWQLADTEGVRLSGVAVSETDAYAVGVGGAVLHRQANGAWTNDSPGLTGENLHAAFIDPSGELWVVGGNFDSTTTLDGLILHKGAALHGSFP